MEMIHMTDESIVLEYNTYVKLNDAQFKVSRIERLPFYKDKEVIFFISETELKEGEIITYKDKQYTVTVCLIERLCDAFTGDTMQFKTYARLID